MYVRRGVNIYGFPLYQIPDLYAKGGGTFSQVKEVYVKSGGVLQKVYNRNLWGGTGSQHPFWQFSLNPEFFVDDGIAYTSFWSIPNNGSYSISGGECQININSLDLITSTQDVTLSTNLTNGSTTAVVKNSADLSPLTQTDIISGANIRWSVSGTGIPSGTTVAALLSSTEIRLSNPATTTQSALNIRYQRSWRSSYDGVTRLQSTMPLSVSPGQTYQLQASPTSGTTSSTSWRFGVITAPNSSGADFFGDGSQVQESGQFFDLANNTWNVTVPSGHNWMRPMIVVFHSSTSYPTNMPRNYRFNWFRVTRTG